ncbi:unnamed protein product [Trichogramma brassicae]|uniref:Uncharacterized protein n=1 Tax=Trichogramma brassicae TaxID=86971 RepID=A0A6H5J120_9HYME|nr:unnamed protein product [Trichogramma brassicae]
MRRSYFSRFHRSVLDQPASDIRPLKSCESRVTHLQRRVVIIISRHGRIRSNAHDAYSLAITEYLPAMLALHALARRSNGSRDQLTYTREAYIHDNDIDEIDYVDDGTPLWTAPEVQMQVDEDLAERGENLVTRLCFLLLQATVSPKTLIMYPPVDFEPSQSPKLESVYTSISVSEALSRKKEKMIVSGAAHVSHTHRHTCTRPVAGETNEKNNVFSVFLFLWRARAPFLPVESVHVHRHFETREIRRLLCRLVSRDALTKTPYNECTAVQTSKHRRTAVRSYARVYCVKNKTESGDCLEDFLKHARNLRGKEEKLCYISTFKKNCPAFIYVRLQKSQRAYEIIDFCEKHENHDGTETLRAIPTRKRAQVFILHEDQDFKGLYFVDEQMVKDLEEYGEIVFVDVPVQPATGQSDRSVQTCRLPSLPRRRRPSSRGSTETSTPKRPACEYMPDVDITPTWCHVGRQGPTSDAARDNESDEHSSSATAVSVHQATRRHLARTAPPF